MSFVRAIFETGASRGALIATAFAISVINARYLGPEGLGLFALLLLARNLIIRYGTLGVGFALSYHTASDPERAGSMRLLAVVAGALLAGISILVFLSFVRLEWTPWRDIAAPYLIPCLLSVLPNFVNQYLEKVLSGQLRIRTVNVASVLFGFGGIAQLLLLGLLVIVMDLGVVGSIWSVAISELLLLVFLSVVFLGEGLATGPGMRDLFPDKQVLGSVFGFGFWTYLYLLITFVVDELPLVLLKYFSATDGPLGIFVTSRALARQGRTVVMPVSQVLYPYTAADSGSDIAADRTSMLCRLSTLPILLLALGAGLIAKPFFVAVYGSEFAASATVFYYLLPMVVLWPITQFLTVHLLAIGRPKAVFSAGLASLAAVSPFAIWLVATFGAIGAAVSVSLFLVVRALIYLIMYTRQYGLPLREVTIPTSQDMTTIFNRGKEMLQARGLWPRRN